MKEEQEWTTFKLFRGKDSDPPEDAIGVIYLIHLGILTKGGFVTPDTAYGQVQTKRNENTTLTLGDILCIEASEYNECMSAF